jgi:hypothetical protein
MTVDEPLLVPAGRGFTIRYRNRYLYPPLDPQGSARRRAERLIGEGRPLSRSLIFVPSLGLGYGLPELLAALPADSHVLCVETDQRLMALAMERARPPLPRDPRLTVARSADPDAIVRLFHSLGAWKFRRVITLALCGGYHLDRPVYDAMEQALQAEVQLFWQNKLTLIRMGRLWVRNLFENLALLPGSEGLAALRTRRPVLVAGAGPSLEDSLAWIRGSRDDLLLAAVDTALPILRDAGLHPDLVFVLEAQAANARDFLGWGEGFPPAPGCPSPSGAAAGPGSALLCDLSSHPALVRRFRPAVRFFASRFAPLRLFDRLESAGLLPHSIPPLGSVGVAAVHLALELTGGPVILAGLDFSYPAGKTHARGAPAWRSALAQTSRLAPADQALWEGLRRRPLTRRAGKGGGPVLTDLVLQSYAAQLSRRIEGERRVFDIGRAGLPLGARPIESAAELARVCRGGWDFPSAPGSPPAAAAAGMQKPSPQTAQASASRPRVGASASRAQRGAWMAKAAAFRLEEARSFLQEEIRLLDGLRGALGGRADRPPEELWRLLEPADYLYLHFPEAEPRPQPDAGFLARVLLSLEDYHRRLVRLAGRLAPARP